MFFSGWQRIYIIFSSVWLGVCINYGYRHFPEVNLLEKWTEVVAINEDADNKIKSLLGCEGVDINLTDIEYALRCATTISRKGGDKEYAEINNQRRSSIRSVDIKYEDALNNLPNERMTFVSIVVLAALFPPAVIYIIVLWIIRGFQEKRR